MTQTLGEMEKSILEEKMERPKKDAVMVKSTSQHISQKLQKSMSLPTLKEILTKFEIMNKMIKHESTTKAIRNAGKVLNMNIIAINKISSELKVWYFEIPHYA